MKYLAEYPVFSGMALGALAIMRRNFDTISHDIIKKYELMVESYVSVFRSLFSKLLKVPTDQLNELKESGQQRVFKKALLGIQTDLID